MGAFVQEGRVYSYKGHNYVVTLYDPDNFLTKDATSGNWSDAVQYTHNDKDSGKTFIRSADDFGAKFEKVESDGD